MFLFLIRCVEHFNLHDEAKWQSVTVGVLRDLKVKSVRLMTNNPGKVHSPEASGVEVIERVPFWVDDHS